MGRSIFRARRVFATALLALPAFAVFGACSNSPVDVKGQMNPGFGDGSTIVPHDATTKTDAHHGDANLGDVVVIPPGDTGTTTTDAAKDSASGLTPCTNDSQCPSGICATKPVVVYDSGVVVDAGVRPNCADAGAGCVCQPFTCTDGVKAETETGIDCGNQMITGCPACPDNQGCNTGHDCIHGVCGHVYAGAACGGPDAGADAGACVCSPSACNDGVKNGEETDVDCGGSLCHACNTGRTCATNGDCVSDICTSGTTGLTCTCPNGMVEVTTSKGAPYCIDAFEVTFGEYQTFLNKNVDPASQPTECSSWNASFAPQGLVVVPGTQTDVNPVTNVNWCDAYMYCKTFNKHLCGSTSTVGTPTPFNSTAQNDETQDEWYNACSTQGSNIYTYGNAYVPNACNSSDSSTQGAGSGSSCVFDNMCNNPHNEYYTWAEGQTIDCNVITPPSTTAACAMVSQELTCHNMAGIFDMSGNVWEWTNSCGGFSAGDGGLSDYCLVRGGSFNSAMPSASTACAVSSAQPPMQRNAVQVESGNALDHEDIGFRCCL